jgi:hypothetical protein
MGCEDKERFGDVEKGRRGEGEMWRCGDVEKGMGLLRQPPKPGLRRPREETLNLLFPGE